MIDRYTCRTQTPIPGNNTEDVVLPDDCGLAEEGKCESVTHSVPWTHRPCTIHTQKTKKAMHTATHRWTKPPKKAKKAKKAKNVARQKNEITDTENHGERPPCHRHNARTHLLRPRLGKRGDMGGRLRLLLAAG